MAVKPACTPPTSTTTPTPSAPSTSPVPCPSPEAPTARAWAASSARPWWSTPSCGSGGSCARATRFAFPASRPSKPPNVKRWSKPASLRWRRPCRLRRKTASTPAPAPSWPMCPPMVKAPRGRAPGRRPLRADGVRTAGAGPGASLSGARPHGRAEKAQRWPRPGRRHRHDTRHPLSAGALRPSRAAARRAVARAAGGRRPPAPAGRHHHPQPRGAPAAVLGRRTDAPGDREVHAVGAARRALVPQQHRVHPPHQRAGQHQRGLQRCLRRQLPRARPGRRLPWRTRGHAGGPAASPGDHQVQPGENLDARERRGHRRCVHVRLRDGGPRRLPVRRPHAADVEPLAAWAPSRAPRLRPALAAALFRRDPLPPLSEAALLRIRASFPHGGYALDIEASSFNLRRYRQFLAEQADSIAAFKARQQASFEAERERWIASGQADFATETDVANASADTELDLPEGGRFVATSVPGNVWQVPVKDGQVVKAGEVLVVVESMKMEFAITSPCDGTVHRVLCREGAPVSAGQDTLILIEH